MILYIIEIKVHTLTRPNISTKKLTEFKIFNNVVRQYVCNVAYRKAEVNEFNKFLRIDGIISKSHNTFMIFRHVSNWLWIVVTKMKKNIYLTCISNLLSLHRNDTKRYIIYIISDGFDFSGFHMVLLSS